MQFRPHLSHHEAIEQLPLLSKRAHVTDVKPMDRDRSAEVRTAIAELLEKQNVRTGAELSDVDTLTTFLATEVEDRTVGRRLHALLERYEQSFPSLLRIRIQTDGEFGFVPGQYIAINYEGIPRAYSLTSQPNQSELEICVRRVPTGRLTSRFATELDIGDSVTVRGPYGDLALDAKSDRDLVFLATGTGVAPFKSIIDYTFREGWDEHDGAQRDVWLFLGAAWEDDLPYYEEFRTLAAEHRNFHFVPTLSRESLLTDWHGETAYVPQVLLKYLDEPSRPLASRGSQDYAALGEPPRMDVEPRLTPENMEVYACGINAMVHSLSKTIREIGVPEEHVQLEGFG